MGMASCPPPACGHLACSVLTPTTPACVHSSAVPSGCLGRLLSPLQAGPIAQQT